MMLRPLVLALLALSCGRDQTLLLGGDDEDGGLRKDGFVTPTDGPILLDDSPLLDLGVDSGSECNRPRDCRMKYGDPPPCPNGGPSFWECTGEGVCQSNCMPGECVNDCDCPFELACLGGICQPAGRINLCCTNPDCPPGDSCIEPGGGRGVCEADPDAGIPDDGGPIDPDAGTIETPVGDPCADQSMCGPIGFCIEEDRGFPDGYCSQDCSAVGEPCPAGAGCRGFGMGNALCLDECTGNPDCRTGYICVQVGLDPQRVCWPMPGGSMNPNGNPVGGECSVDDECGSGLQCLDFMGWPDGYCTKQFCDPVTNACPMGSSCFNFPGFLSLCLDDCPNGGTQSDCRDGYYCLGPTGEPGGCVPN